MALSLIAASGETRARLRDTKPQVTSLLSSLSRLQKVSSQYVRRKGPSASRVNDVVIPTGHEIFSDVQDYVPFHEWKRKTFYHVNKQNDQRKKEITERINSRKKIAWTKKSVSEYLVSMGMQRRRTRFDSTKHRGGRHPRLPHFSSDPPRKRVEVKHPSSKDTTKFCKIFA